jgi:hypothetical protein
MSGASSVAEDESSRHRVISEVRTKQVKATLRSAENEDFLREIGRCLEAAQNELGWTLDELSGELPPPPNAEKRDPRQVQRWIDGKERCQVDVVFQVRELRAPFVEALARLSGAFEISRTLKRRIA